MSHETEIFASRANESRVSLPVPRLPMTIRPATMPDIPFIDRLQKKQAVTLALLRPGELSADGLFHAVGGDGDDRVGVIAGLLDDNVGAVAQADDDSELFIFTAARAVDVAEADVERDDLSLMLVQRVMQPILDVLIEGLGTDAGNGDGLGFGHGGLSRLVRGSRWFLCFKGVAAGKVASSLEMGLLYNRV
jgi:hypothetical protein